MRLLSPRARVTDAVHASETIDAKGEAMKQQDVVLGEVYAMKVSGSIQPVKLEAESPHGGWVGRNMRSGREVRIRTAAKLRCPLKRLD
jgi:hypothetical protein